MKVGKQSGEWAKSSRKLGQAHAEKAANKSARSVWMLYWKKYDQRHGAKTKR